MPRAINKLNAVIIANLNERGLYSDGAGLWLQVSKWGTKAWIFRYMRFGKRHQMGLGPLHTVSLQEARTRARQARQLILDGKDPLGIKREAIVAEKVAKAKEKSFAECANEYLKAKISGFRNDKHRGQWRTTLEQYAFPVLGNIPVNQIDTPLVLKVLQPLWERAPETASRLRGRIERVLAFATVKQLRSGDNPARWHGHLKEMFAAKPDPKHHKALPFAELPAFMARLRAKESLSARALEFTILTAARTGEVIGATWDEIDLKAKMWTVPGERMKAGREHVVPLPDRAVEILEAMPKREGRIFALTDVAMRRCIRQMDANGYAVHGFRSSFRDWAGDRTAFAHEVIEFALAHKIPDKASASYRRYSALEKRRKLMEAFARYCNAPAIKGEVVALHG